MDRSREPAAPRGVHSPTESRIIAVLDEQNRTDAISAKQHTAKRKTDSKAEIKRQCTCPSQREEGWKEEEPEEDPEKVYMDHLQRCCDNGDELDYYQLMAFYSS